MAEADRRIYPIEPWSVSDDPDSNLVSHESATVFSLANGYVGVRGTLEEDPEAGSAASFINGFYETEKIVHAESAYGLATHRQVMVPVGNFTSILVYVNDQLLDPANARRVRSTRTVDLEHGVLRRQTTWRLQDGRDVEITATRLVSFRRQHVLAIHWELRSNGPPCDLRLRSVIRGRAARNGSGDPRVGGGLAKQPLMLGRKDANDRVATIRLKTRNSEFDAIIAIANVIETEAGYERTLETRRDEVGHGFNLRLPADGSVELTKYVAMYTSQDYPRKRLTGLARREIETARRSTFSGLSAEQSTYLKSFWSRSDVVIDGDDALQQSIRYNIFHLLQASGRNGRTSVAAKGLTGPGYEGHYFWDTEIYIMPFLTYTNPGIARAILEYRYRTLGRARERAATLHHRGALYPWRTINGNEASAYFPAGTAQYHINADVIYAMRKYVNATGDRWFLLKRGAEMLFETARLWADLGCFIEGKGFCINEVTGPDEYTAMVNNNVYTNLMASDHLSYAVETFRQMQRHDRLMLDPLIERLELTEDEITLWERCAQEIHIPFDEGRQLYPQDDGFFDRECWDFENTPAENYPLLLHYHPLTIYRHQVLKQPDTVLALFLQGDRFSSQDKVDNFRFYDPLTTGDSSLAPCIQSIVAAEIGDIELAYSYFMKTARMDLDNINGNVGDGVHTAAMAGTWLSMVYGFAGMRDFGGALSFRPQLPRQWNRLRFSILWHGTQIDIQVGPSETTYHLPRGGRLSLNQYGKVLELSGTEEVRVQNGAD